MTLKAALDIISDLKLHDAFVVKEGNNDDSYQIVSEHNWESYLCESRRKKGSKGR